LAIPDWLADWACRIEAQKRIASSVIVEPTIGFRIPISLIWSLSMRRALMGHSKNQNAVIPRRDFRRGISPSFDAT
jgi:hypothetical protein